MHFRMQTDIPTWHAMALKSDIRVFHTARLQHTKRGCNSRKRSFRAFYGDSSCHKAQKAVLPAPGFFGYEHVLRAVGCDIGYFLLDEQSDFSPAARLDALMDMLTDDTDIFLSQTQTIRQGILQTVLS